MGNGQTRPWVPTQTLQAQCLRMVACHPLNYTLTTHPIPSHPHSCSISSKEVIAGSCQLAIDA